jgi:hypothetical protein
MSFEASGLASPITYGKERGDKKMAMRIECRRRASLFSRFTTHHKVM